MKTKLFTLLILSLFVMPVLAQGNDTISVDLGSGVRLSILSANFGFVVKCAEDTEDEDVDAIVVPQVSIGPRYAIIVRKTWGLNGYLLFSSAEENQMYPTLGAGVSIMDHQVVLGYWLGPVPKSKKLKEWEQRVRVMVSFSLR